MPIPHIVTSVLVTPLTVAKLAMVGVQTELAPGQPAVAVVPAKFRPALDAPQSGSTPYSPYSDVLPGPKKFFEIPAWMCQYEAGFCVAPPPEFQYPLLTLNGAL